ncbi:MAG: flagellar hook-length control protein FliK [Gammaproteobacteria bacterium]|nr:flagellar hook-length control protein FliK [Gammaproteobacteria bacterium]MBU1553347.1 flagellar hook-length control protein FliK [Gammaproteobacteria bacterium]MBU2070791.1 flagellar hook-length control protein FliK [Gammaproteobacteria bacterium]MBU2182782.1 flagellar hook-length control protein FliK [Gammaproteobacteria bacterium]MBU2205976.1 flagellar hook-length control protein FliK [Gammaproteobacteria bacterium]
MQQWLLNKAGANQATPLQSGRVMQGQAEADGQPADSYSALLARMPQLSDAPAQQAPLVTPLQTELAELADTELAAAAENAAIMAQNLPSAELSALSVLHLLTKQTDSAVSTAQSTPADVAVTAGLLPDDLVAAGVDNEGAGAAGAAIAMAMPLVTAGSTAVATVPTAVPDAPSASGLAGSLAAMPRQQWTAPAQAQLIPVQLTAGDDFAAATPAAVQATAQPSATMATLPLADGVLQQFGTGDVAVRPMPVLADSAPVALTAAANSAGATATAAPQTLFQWKAEQLGSQSSQWGQKLMHLLSDKINLQLGQQIQRAQIRLDPPQLGLIELTVSLDAERTSVQLYASNSQMRDAMQQNLEQLRQQLSQRLGQDQLLQLDVRDQPAQQHQPQHQPGAIAAQHTDDAINQTAVPAAVNTLTTDRLNRLV